MVDQTLTARGIPKTARIGEYYGYNVKITRSSTSSDGDGLPSGRIVARVPDDGTTEGAVSRLTFDKHEKTGLNENSELTYSSGSLSLHLPIQGGAAEPEYTNDRRQAAVVSIEYSPHWPRVRPLGVEIRITDEAQPILSNVKNPDFNNSEIEALASVASLISENVNFRHSLTISTYVILKIPLGMAQTDSKPRVKKFTLNWPTMTSFRALQLRISGKKVEPLPMTYDPGKKRLELHDVRMDLEFSSANSELDTYISESIELEIDHPGELYNQTRLTGQVDVEIPNRLLSEMEVGLHDLTGKLRADLRPELSTSIIGNLDLVLDDAFARRIMSPYQLLHFDGVIPEDARVSDIKSSLANIGFQINNDFRLPSDQNELKHFIDARRLEGPSHVQLWVLIEGRRFNTQREMQLPGAQTYETSQTYTSTFESGEINVYLRGEYPGNSRGLMLEMTALQTELRARFVPGPR